MVRTHTTATVPAAMVLQASQLDPASGVLSVLYCTVLYCTVYLLQGSQLDPGSGVLSVRLTVGGVWMLQLLAASPGQVLTFSLHQASTSPGHTIFT